MKKRQIQTIEQNGHTFGQVSNPADLNKTQDFLHTRISDLAHDFLNNQKSRESVGFSYALGDGNAFNITIAAPGRIYDTEGKSFELAANTTLPIVAADTVFPRLDLVVAVLEANVDAETALIPFVRLRTSDEFTSGAAAYPPQNLSVATEKHWRAVVQMRTGAASTDSPSLPVLASNEVPLYLISVAPGAAQIRDEDVRDLRESPLTLRSVNDLTGRNKIDLAILRELVEKNADIGSLFVSGFQLKNRTLKDILQSLQKQLNVAREMPEVRYDKEKVLLTDSASSKIVASGAIAAGVPVVNIEIGGKINFGDVDVVLNPTLFPAEVNARFAKTDNSPANATNEEVLTLQNITQIAADGSLDFALKSAQFAAPRARPGCAARDENFIEIFGGLAQDNKSALGEWLTYDIQNDTLTPRAPSIALPSADRPAAMSFGDGTHVLYIAGHSADDTPSAFKINALTGVVTTITTTTPTGYQFFGDLIADGKIFVVAIKKDGGTGNFVTEFWEFDTNGNQFTQLGVTGSIPDCQLDYAGGCFYKENQFVLVSFEANVSESGKTYIFNRANLQWTRANISQPYGGTTDKQSPLRLFQMANINGRPVLVGALLSKDTDGSKAKVWELTLVSERNQIKTLKWGSYNASFTPLRDGGLCSALADGRPQGKAFLIAGQGQFSNAQQTIYASVQGGIVATTHRGEQAITIADSSTYAEFVVPIYNALWDVAGYLLSLKGEFDSSNLKAEVSFDNGANFVEVGIDKYASIDQSSAPGIRQLRITLYNLKSSKPILSRLFEVFDQDGILLENRVVIRYDSPSVVKALYVDRFGLVTLSGAVVPSTPENCLLHKVSPNSASAPTVKNYINRRRPHIKYSKVKSNSVAASESFDNELAVPVRYVNATKVGAGNQLYKIADPAPDFDALIVVAGVTDGETWIVELEG